MTFYEDLVNETQISFMVYNKLYAAGGTAEKLSRKQPLNYEEQIKELINYIKDAEVVVVGGASGLSAAGGGDFYYSDNDSPRIGCW